MALTPVTRHCGSTEDIQPHQAVVREAPHPSGHVTVGNLFTRGRFCAWRMTIFLYESTNLQSAFLASKRITNCCASSPDDLKFAGEICSDMEATEFGPLEGRTGVPLDDLFPSLYINIGSRRPFAELSQEWQPFVGQRSNKWI